GGARPRTGPHRPRDHREVRDRELHDVRGVPRGVHEARLPDRGGRRGRRLFGAGEDRPPEPPLPEDRPRADQGHRLELHPARDDPGAQGLCRPDRLHHHRGRDRAGDRAQGSDGPGHRLRPGLPPRSARRHRSFPSAPRSQPGPALTTSEESPSPKSSSLALFVLVGLAVLSPWPFGSVHPLAVHFVTLVPLTTSALALAWAPREGGLRLPALPLLPLFGLLAPGLLHLLP